MPRASFLQSEIDKVLKAAAKTGGIVQVDLREMVVTIYPAGSVVQRASGFRGVKSNYPPGLPDDIRL